MDNRLIHRVYLLSIRSANGEYETQTDPANPAIRPTEDVDIVVAVVALADYRRIEELLRERDFAQDMRPYAAICRGTRSARAA